MKTLIILAHPNIESSLSNKTIVNEVIKNPNQVTLRNISELYPSFNIDVKAEQDELLKYDTIVFQYPFYWYNIPAILKHWFDEVFEYQFAYGSEGDKLKDKNFQLSFTIGGPQDSYNAIGYNNFRIPEFLKGLEQTAYLAQMNYLEPIFTHNMIFIDGIYNVKDEVLARAVDHSKRLLNVINRQFVISNDDN